MASSPRPLLRGAYVFSTRFRAESSESTTSFSPLTPALSPLRGEGDALGALNRSREGQGEDSIPPRRFATQPRLFLVVDRIARRVAAEELLGCQARPIRLIRFLR